MRMPTNIPMQSPDNIQDEETKKLIKELQDTIRDLIAILYGDIKEIEERLVAGGL